MLDAYGPEGLLSSAPLTLPLERDLREITALSYPARCWQTRTARLLIADSGYNRLVITDFDGRRWK